MSNDEYVQVYVRKSDLPRVYRLIGSLDEEANAPVVEPVGASSKEWSADLLKKQYVDASKTIKALERFLADHEGERFTGDELAAGIGLQYGWNSIAGALGAASRRHRNHYGRQDFPFDIDYDDDDELARYSMPSKYATIIKSL